MMKLVMIFLVGAVVSYAAVRYGPTWLGWETEYDHAPSESVRLQNQSPTFTSNMPKSV